MPLPALGSPPFRVFRRDKRETDGRFQPSDRLRFQSSQMRVRVLFFGVLKDLAGRSSEDAEFAEDADLRAVLDRYAALSPAVGKMAGSIVVARNQAFAEPATKIAEGDEIALLPPVSGGSEAADPLEIAGRGNYFAITRHVDRSAPPHRRA